MIENNFINIMPPNNTSYDRRLSSDSNSSFETLTNNEKCSEIDGVKWNCKKQYNGKLNAMKRADEILNTSLEQMYLCGNKSGFRTMLSFSNDFVRLYSKDLGKKTTIMKYTNKKGRTHDAHYTINLQYYGPVSRIGKEPVYYWGYFPCGRFADSIPLNLEKNPYVEVAGISNFDWQRLVDGTKEE